MWTLWISSSGTEKAAAQRRDKRLASDHSITIRGNEWYDHPQRKAGMR